MSSPLHLHSRLCYALGMETPPIPEPEPDALSPAVCHEVLRTCGSFNLRKAARAVTQLYDDILQPTGLCSTQVVLLVLLAAEPAWTLTRLGRQLVLSPSTLSRSLRPLVREGLVELVPVGPRGKLVRLTPTGHRALRVALPYWQQAQERFMSLVGPERWSQVAECLAQMVAVTRV